ncbi:MAG: hypothetical protein Kow0089_12790 [Desulfobulbaceae bacterium]
MGSWKGFFQGGDNDGVADGLVQFRQLYNASWHPLVTRKILFSADMGYSNNWVENLGTRELVNPSLRLGVRNDLFNWSLNGDYLENNLSFREDVHTYTWNSNLRSSWTNFLWPQLTFRMGQQLEERGSFGLKQAEDSTYSYIGSSISWSAYNFKLFYDYTRSRRDKDSIDHSSQEDIDGHLAKLEYNDNFWANKVTVSFSQLFYDNKTDFSSGGGDNLLQVTAASGRSGVDLTPTAGTLPLNQALIDGNREVSAVTIQLQQPVNLALQTRFNSIDRLYVYTTRDDRLLVANTQSVSWDLYTSNDGANWQRVAGNLTGVFNDSEFRFEIFTGDVRAEFVKLVATGWIPALDLNITEVEAYDELPAGSSGDYDRETKNYKTELYLGLNPVTSTRFNYTFSWDRTDNTGINESETEQVIQTARLGWYASSYFTPSVGFNQIINKNDAAGAADTETRTYDVQIRSTPIPTVDVGLTYSWNEHFEDEERQRTVNSISFSTLAKLYPDLSAELILGYNQGKDEITDEENEGTFISFIMHAWLRKTFNVNLQTTYNFADSSVILVPGGHPGQPAAVFQNTSSESGETILSAHWRPSSILSFSLRGTAVYGDGIDTEYGGSLTTNYQVFSSSKTNLTFSHILTFGMDRDTVNNFLLTWGWDISNHFTLNTSGNYIITGSEDSWNMFSQLTAKF